MIRIGQLKFGIAALSTLILLVVLSVCAIFVSFSQARPESPMPLGQLLMINEGFALLVTLLYGIFIHVTLYIINRFRK